MMRRMVFPILLLSLALGSLPGCGGEEISPTPAPAQKKKPVAKAPVPAKEATAAPEAEKEAVYVYDPLGRRDPFEAIVQVGLPSRVETEPLTPLQKFDLDQFKLIGIILGKGAPVAMVVAPDQKSYFLKKGVKIGRNDGVVVGVDQDSVTIEEKYFDMSGSEQKSIQKIQLPKREGV